MLELFVHSLEITLISLLAVLCIRVKSLYLKNFSNGTSHIDHVIKRLIQGDTASNSEYEAKMESLQKAQIFSGNQLLEIKRNYGDLHQKNLAWLREAISLYLIGAIDFIGKQAHCGTQSRKELITVVLKSNLHLSSENTEAYFKEALYRKLSSDNDLMVRAGAKAAKAWLSQESIPSSMTLTTQLDDWGVFA